MMKVQSTFIRNIFNVNVLKNEIFSVKGVKNISNKRLEKTLFNTNQPDKKATLQEISKLMRLSDNEKSVKLSNDCFYLHNYANIGHPLLVVHGIENGGVSVLSSSKGNRTEEDIHSVKDFIKILQDKHGIDLCKSSLPIHIMSCFGASNGNFQEFSNLTNRVIYGYGEKKSLLSVSSEMENFITKEQPAVSYKPIKDPQTGKIIEAEQRNSATVVKKYVPHKTSAKTVLKEFRRGEA